MKISSERIADKSIETECLDAINRELENGKLKTYKEDFPDAHIVLSPGPAVDLLCLGTVIAEKGEPVGSFSVSDNGLLIMSILRVVGT